MPKKALLFSHVLPGTAASVAEACAFRPGEHRPERVCARFDFFQVNGQKGHAGKGYFVVAVRIDGGSRRDDEQFGQLVRLRKFPATPSGFADAKARYRIIVDKLNFAGEIVPGDT